MMNINIIDIEASGLHFDSHPIEIAVLVNGQTRSWLIKPEPNWKYWNATAESLHGISREQLASEGLPAIQVARELSDFLQDSNGLVYSDAVYWDTDWIDTLYSATKQDRHFHIVSIYDLLDGSQKALFEEQLKVLAGSGAYRHHRAAEDVRMIYDAYLLALEGI